MTKGTALLLVLLGACQALQPGLEYQYRYSARIATGIPNINRQFAASGIQADVTVQMSDDHTLSFQFNNVEVGNLNEVLGCDLRSPLPIEYHPLTYEAALLEKPFQVSTNGTHFPAYLEGPDEPVWITNIRKSVVNIFRVDPLWHQNPLLNYGVMEESLVGRCQSWYTSLKLPEHLAEETSVQRENSMEEDVQREGASSGSYTKRPGKTSKTSKTSSKTSKTGKTSKTSSKTSPGRLTNNVPPIDDTLWAISRTTDFGYCEHTLQLEIHANKHSNDAIQRSTVGNYLIRGDKFKRIEQAIIEGSITIITNDDEHEHIDTFTNQTLELRAVRELGDSLVIDYDVHTHYSWHFGLSKPHGNEYIPLEQVITGRPVDSAMLNSFSNFIKESIEVLITRMDGHPHPDPYMNLAYEIGRLVDAVSNLDYPHIEALFDEYSASADLKRYIFEQLVIMSGTEPAITFLVDKLKADAIPATSSVKHDLYKFMESHIRSPAVIPKILELLLNEEDSLTHSIGLMNFATLASKACLSVDRNHFFNNHGCGPSSNCDPEGIINTFIPHLVHGLNNHELPNWHRLIYAQALSNLGTPHTLSFLKPIILGSTDQNVLLRTNAIWSLSAFNMHKTALLTQVYELLMPIIENRGEPFEIRNIAFLTMLTWGPGNAWWQRMAVMTWHDPSHQFVTFVTSTIRTVAESHSKVAEHARRVTHLLKPAPRYSLIHSSNIFLHEYLFSEEHNTRLNFAWFSAVHGFIPEEVFIRLEEHFFYGYSKVTKVDVQQRGLDKLFKFFKKLKESKKQTRPISSAQEIVTEMWEELKEKIGIQLPTTPAEVDIWLKINRLMVIADEIPLNEDVYSYMEKYLRQPMFYSVNVPQYERALNTFIAFPTEVGVPFSVHYSVQHATWVKAEVRPGGVMSPSKIKANVDVVAEHGTIMFVDARTYTPWSDRPSISSGLYNRFDLVLPFHVLTTITIPHPEVHFSLEPTKTEKINLIFTRTTPYTVLEYNYPADVNIIRNTYRPITLSNVPVYEETRPMVPTISGLVIEEIITGDIRTPQFPFNLIDTTGYPLHQYSTTYKIVFDPAASSTKSVSFTFTFVSSGGSGAIVEGKGQTQEGDYGGQTSQTSEDYEFEGQETGQTSYDTDLYIDSEVDTFGIYSETRQRIAKMQQQLIVLGGQVKTLGILIELQGTASRNYEASLTWASSGSPSSMSTKLQFTFTKHPGQGLLEDPHITCLNAQIIKPRFHPFLSVEQAINSNYHTTVKMELYDGVTCEDAPVLTVVGSVDVTDKSRDKMREHIAYGCEYNNYAPVIDILTSNVYDHVHLTAEWTPNFSDNLKNITYHGYDLLRGAMHQHIQYDYTSPQPEYHIAFDAEKCVVNELWTVRTVKPHEVTVGTDIPMPELMKMLFRPSPLLTNVNYDFIVGRTPVACSVSETMVRTFDGKEFSYEPSECWNSMTFDTSENQVGSIMVRHTGQWEVRVIWHSEGLVIDMSSSSFLVNGEEAQGTDNRYKVLHSEGSHTIIFSTGSRIKVSHKVDVILSMNHRGYSAGLCGNFDGEPFNDMVGPTGCSYSDPSLFALSWASPGEGCRSFTFNAKKRTVENYQEHCNRFAYVPTGVAYSQVNDNCFDWVYHEKDVGGSHCKALTPTPVCKPGCTGSKVISTPIKYECTFIGHQLSKLQHQSEQQQSEEQRSQVIHECFEHTYPLEFESLCLPIPR